MSMLSRASVLSMWSSLLAASAAAQCTNDWVAWASASTDVHAIARWDPDGPGPLGERMVFGGSFTAAGGIPANRIAVWDPATSAWTTLGSGFDNSVHALTGLPNGDLVAGGFFTASGGTPLARIARWDGAQWQPLGAGITATFGIPVRGIVALPNGDLVVAGAFTEVGGVLANSIARWDGAAWSSMGSTVTYPGAFALLRRANGDLLVGHQHGVRRFDGAGWVPFGSGLSARVLALAERANGEVVAGGVSGVQVSDGGTWTPLGTGFTSGFPLIASIEALLVLPDGDVVAGGSFVQSGGQTLNNVARWRGSAWSPFGTGTNGTVYALGFTGTGDLLAGGGFTSAGGNASGRLARLATSCPAVAADLGGGCPSAGGANVLQAATQPWVDATLWTRGRELPPHAIVGAVTGLSTIPPFPLDSVLLEAVPGCTLGVSPDIVQVYLTATGTIDSPIFLPNTPPLVGVSFFQQLLVVELDPADVWVAITTTNVLQLTAGDW